jgi:hypothetical protein
LRPTLPRLYRQRLRSRIVISFLLLGTGLTALFAVATVLLREQMENQLIGAALQQNVDDYSRAFHLDPKSTDFAFEKISGWTYSKRKFANVPFAWRDLPDGVHNLIDSGSDTRQRVYKLAVKKEPEFWFFLRCCKRANT